MSIGYTDHERDLAASGGDRHGLFLLDWAELGYYIRHHPAARLPGDGDKPIPLNIRVKGGTQEEKLTDLEDIARSHGVQVRSRGSVWYAERRFGCFLLEAHVNPDSIIYVNPAARELAA